MTEPSSLQPGSILVFEPHTGGHHASYLASLLAHGPDDRPSSWVVAPSFPERHPELMSNAARRGISVVPLTPEEGAALTRSGRGRLAPARRALTEWGLLCRYATRLGASQAVTLYFDPLLQLCLPLRFSAPVPISGIYFRPTLHYPGFPDGPALGARERLRAARQTLALRAALGHPRLGVIFSLDPLAVPALQALGPQERVRPLPDPVEPLVSSAAEIEALRSRLQIAPERKIALMFGALTARKGLSETLRALGALRRAELSRLTLLVVGRVAPALYAEVERARRSLGARAPGSVVVQDEFVPEGEVQRYFELADVVLAPYQEHVGSSGIQIRAAAAGRPLIGPSYGLMGELTRRHRLGARVDSTSPQAILEALRAVLQGSSLGVSPAEQRRFAESHTGASFAEAFFRGLESVAHRGS
ncbi:MAG: glycosyltransferase [Polyangiaceae bacterium]|nr:glycosyltransferase [Polyangiaceae bacterium]